MATNKIQEVKFIAVSRLTDRKTILAMNPQENKQQFNKEVSSHNLDKMLMSNQVLSFDRQQFQNEVTNIVKRTTMNQVNSALKTGHFSDETDSMQGTWYSQVHSQPAQIMFSGKYSQSSRHVAGVLPLSLFCSAHGRKLRRSVYQRITAIAGWRRARRSQKTKTESFG